MPPRHLRPLIAFAILAGLFVAPTGAAERFITIASTTSTDNSGLFSAILPRFQQESGIAVRVIALGTGQAIKAAERGDADVLFVHHKPSEEQFVAAGSGVQRYDVMYNDFVIVGPRTDPAGVQGMTDASAALAQVAAQRAVFVSRGDDSGTHKLEVSLWQAAGVSPTAASGSWYREVGAGMGATLNMASAMGGYALTDRATWLSFKNTGGLALLVEGDARLFNQYGVILVNPEKHRHVKAADGQTFIDWLLSDRGQQAIAAFHIQGEQLFFPNAKQGRP
jgi:tungstate transport system substrate-binding protein